MVFNEVTVRASDGVQLSCRVAGTGSTTLLFLHGWGGSGSGPFWDGVLQHLDPGGLRLVLADLRGHGRSAHARDGYTTERFAHDMFDVADQVEAQDLIVVAFSMSGRWAQWMACTQPHRVRGQILLGAAPAAALPLTEDMLDQWVRATATQETFEPFIGQFTKTRLGADALKDYYASAHATPELSLRESYRMCTHPGFSDSLGATRARTLVVAGAHDPMLPAEYLREEIVRKIPGARLVVLDCGHEIPLELPRETAAVIDAFVAGLATGQSPQAV
jgi:pimeloyl-ACP methyl ester carboxylesterase